jgi:hypothetical protein
MATYTTRIKSYSELIRHHTFEDRYNYLRLGGGVGVETFGRYRDLNQDFYASAEWHAVREHVIRRDEGCDLGIPGHEIYDYPVVHHLNPMSPEDIIHGELWILDPEYLVTVTRATHNAIHYGSELTGPVGFIERRPNDTKSW